VSRLIPPSAPHCRGIDDLRQHLIPLFPYSQTREDIIFAGAKRYWAIDCYDAAVMMERMFCRRKQSKG
jgi:hypothetical protein